MISIEYKSPTGQKWWIYFGTTNNYRFTKELLKVCRYHHPGCRYRTQEGTNTSSQPLPNNLKINYYPTTLSRGS